MIMLLISIAKALVEIAAMCLVAQMLVGLFSPAHRESNPIYQLFAIVTRPVNSLVRLMMPRFVINEHITFASLFVLATLWFGLLMLKVQAHA